MNADADTLLDERPARDRCRLPVSHHFPPEVREALVFAAATSTVFDPLARVKAINRATEKARFKYPELFRKDFAS